ncbi:ATP-dependent RNA helicase TDRD9-like [Saccoglossus kowalevskii]
MSSLTSDLTLNQIDEWFKIGAPPPKAETIPRSKLQGHYLDPTTGEAYQKRSKSFIPPYKRNPRDNNPKQTEYAQKYLEEERQRELRLMKSDTDLGLPILTTRSPGGLSDLDFATTSDVYETLGFPDQKPLELAAEVYKHYRFDHTYSPDLPITEFQDQIISTIESNQVTVIQGSTGSGKTTQVPQYILDHYASENRYVNIVVTQPRRIAAISIAKRVCAERGWQLGSLVGYQVALDRCITDDTRLTYLTTGVLLQKLINSKNMNMFTHVILDEVHERDQDSDFSLLVVRKLLRSTSRHVKIILMSATIESDLFAGYFSLPVRGKLESAPVVSVEGKAYDVTEYYLEDLRKFGQMPFLERDNPSVSPDAIYLARQLILEFDQLELKEQEERIDGFPANRGTVLVFLPGIYEINETFQALNDDVIRHRLWLLPLHSSITSEEQSQVFLKAEKGRRKIILATNIAESSITVTDIKYVIDFMLIKCLVCDPETNYQSLQLSWASKANATQRKGRAGRVSSGKVYRMITRDFWDRNIHDYGIPEMARCPLELLVLQVKILDLGEPKAILALALTPPNLDDIERTILLLKEVGALSTVTSGILNPHDGDLTFVGRVLASLPVDIKIGKLMVLGHVFGCLEECIIIGASLSLQSFFAQPFREYLNAYRSKMTWANDSFSDCIAMLNAYKMWEGCNWRGEFRRSGSAELTWCRKNMIQLKRIRKVAETVKELKERLANHNIKVPRHGPNLGHQQQQAKTPTNAAQDLLILKLVICGAFYPNYFQCGPPDEAEALRTLSGKDPTSTVMVKNVPPMGHLYKNQIAALFRTCGKGNKLYFEDTRCYIEFERPREIKEQSILPAVYLAVKMRHLRTRLELQLTEISAADQKMLNTHTLRPENKLRTNRLGVLCEDPADGSNKIRLVTDNGNEPKQVDLPAAGNNWIDIFVTEVVDANHFWAHYGDAVTFQNLRNLMDTLNQYDGIHLKPIVDACKGQICLAPYMEDKQKFYRARIDSLHGDAVEVFFVDYGNVDVVPRKNLREVPSDLLKLPFQAFECVLSGIKPYYLLPDSKWMPQAKQKLIEVVSDKIMFAKIYSVVRNCLRIELFDTTRNPQVNINELMIKLEFAEKCEEPYSSRVNHEQREEASIETSIDEQLVEIPQETVLRVIQQGRRKGRVFLHGPFSPYEMNFYPMTQVGRFRSTRVEPGSVNSVALNSEPQDKHERMMVSALVSVNSSGTALMARDTSLMPNIHGLAAIVSMLFAPAIELRTDPQKRRYTGVLCGLGWDPDSNGAALPDHDMEITFDANITTDDISMINGVRMAINIAVGSEDAIAEWGPAAIFRIQKSAREKLLRLIMKRRELVTPYNYERPYRWNMVNPDDILPHELEGTKADCPVLYQLFDAIAVSGDLEASEEDSDRREKMIAHLRDLKERAGRSIASDPVYCQLCEALLHSPKDLLLHMETEKHQTKERHVYHPQCF